jgi:hypothetical protein
VDDDFDDGALDSRWTRVCTGRGVLTEADSALRLALPGAEVGRYSDAQIDDYDHLPPARYLWRAPLRLEVRARSSHPAHPAHPATTLPSSAPGEPQVYLRGTFGFGFWNYPFSLDGRVLRLPDAVWFFGASPPSNMALVPGVAGWGWKAQVVHAHRLGALAAAVPTIPAVLAARLTGRDGPAAGWVRRVSGAAEVPLATNLAEWHTYTLEWLPNLARFAADGVQVLAVRDPPRGPLGFVAWIDNQYAIATPRGAFGFGTVASGPEWLELDRLRITPL